ncbi:MAG: DUF4870 domain-containing protein, partial [Thermanaerothrix sp.]|nr:DUF4870 domain-containing protein [Thermanaerothrix sp.]
NLISQDVSSALFVITQAFLLLSLAAAWGALALGGVIAAVLCLSGRDVRYPLLGRHLERTLCTEADLTALDPEREARWMAALTYGGVLVRFFGWLLPLIVWLTQKDRSPLLRIHALQSLIYQGIGNLLLFLASLWVVLTTLPLMFVLALVESIAASWVPVLLIPFGLLVLGRLAFSFIYVILGLWAGLRLAQGYEVTLPGLGPWLRQRLTIPASTFGGSHA